MDKRLRKWSSPVAFAHPRDPIREICDFVFPSVFVLLLCPCLSCSDLNNDTTQDFCDPPIGQWQYLGLGDESIASIAIDQTNPSRVLVGSTYDLSTGAEGNLFRTTDCGKTWQLLRSGGSYLAVAINPLDASEIYAVPGSVVKSNDGGSTWRAASAGIPLNQGRVMALAMDQSRPNVVYAGTGGLSGGSVYKSNDAGLTWNRIMPDSVNDGITSLAVDPINPNNIFAGTAGRGLLLKSTNGGNEWEYTGLGQTNQLIHDILVVPTQPSTVFIGINILGVFRSEDSGVSWSDVSQGLSMSVRKVCQMNDQWLFIVATLSDTGGIYRTPMTVINWERIGVDAFSGSYYYSAMETSPSRKEVYFGLHGLYRMRFD